MANGPTIDKKPFTVNLALVVVVILGGGGLIVNAVNHTNEHNNKIVSMESQVKRNITDIDKLKEEVDDCDKQSSDALHQTEMIRQDVQTIKGSVQRLERYLLPPPREGD